MCVIFFFKLKASRMSFFMFISSHHSCFSKDFFCGLLKLNAVNVNVIIHWTLYHIIQILDIRY